MDYMGFVKNTEDINKMRKGGKILAEILSDLKKMLVPGKNCLDLEKEFVKMCRKNDVSPTCKGYAPYGMPPFPTGLCLSINNQSVHCFPRKGVVLEDGDVVTVDTVINYKGLNVDAAFSTIVGKEDSKLKKKLVDTAEKVLYETISEVGPGVRIGRISNKMQKIVESQGLNVLKDYAGHGIGREMHEYPEVPCYGDINDGAKLLEGMTICIEALICTGSDSVVNVSEWETCMEDGGYFAQAEHTILVTKDGYEILTLKDK
ncbi:MAG: Methionine aminopeptidase [candidate division WWE3 bacterium GW2011_GWF2_41_45]|uniref:Methionine aminopeptidase n=3 Tax=Katanobacteria TaxID=422282 RepID=A0A0G0YT61_UNCKA|nr:MAG: Methionine aminopeptidase [candidate division WWE3 bacterium GW2011_GWC2_41_23]KKS10667.1 MAG: Methionine aminopeptidase [candidate division WWE3 bacterium GW2011_GWF2_41_45]KKS12322.1 MAG: Methionine aminopeptidase [candidate division WWE3 bacterium GW2011_GWF1_41_53]KKS20396.1 MAG: Methionine aminopeptidase [candidate division WWE3 bacterium GW2011_GWE1_41_72]KKS28342.1 MAG: Methionine aminopeptidase [candidate division WWE3 bacterium GW2011_GWC1_42_102]KKS30328.1 MAG: Methionine ami